MTRLNAATTGYELGRNTNENAVHSNGQPSRKISSSTRGSMTIGGSSNESRELVIQLAVPSRANTAPKMLEVTASNSTMLDVAMVASSARWKPGQVKRP